MTDTVESLSRLGVELQDRACRLRMEADQRMAEANELDRQAAELEARLTRLGLKTIYAGSLERERTAFRLLDEAGIYMRVKR